MHDVLSGLLKLHPNQYLLRGGTYDAIKQTAKALKEDFRWAVEIDISNCYQSFDGSELAKLLPLPKEVTDNLVISACLNLVPGNLQHYLGPADDDPGDPITLAAGLADARRGIPQGSAAAPLVAEAVLAIALYQVPQLGVIIAYADNILLLAKSESDVASMTEALLAALEEHPVGRLRPRPTVFKAGQPIEFLGHALTPKDDVVRIEPDENNRLKFECRVASELTYLIKAKLQPLARAKRLQRLQRYVQDWTAAFKLCDGIEIVRAYWLAKIPNS